MHMANIMDMTNILASHLQLLAIFAILISLFLLSLYLCLSPTEEKSCIPTNWPVVGMLPGVLRNSHRVHDYVTEILKESGGTFEIKGPWLSNTNTVLTSNPANVHYVLSKNFSNYPKGPKLQEVLDIFGEGMFNTDEQLWEIHRKVTLSILHRPDYRIYSQETVLEKLEESLHPMLGNFAKTGMEIDMQDIIDRFMFDVFASLILDDDAGCLSPGLPTNPCQWGFSDAEKAIVQRHILPESWWKLQRWLNFGKERELRKAWEAIDEYMYACIEKKPELFTTDSHNEGLQFILKAYQTNVNCPPITKIFLRDVLFSLFAAGKETTSTALTWFFFLLAKNPSVETKILEEVENIGGMDQIIRNMGDYSHKLVYLHGALCETMRLFPPAALQHRRQSQPDVLPSGISISADTKLFLSFYSMGRMESIWGKDCSEFKPERWITEQGRIRHQPSSKFVAFNAGPRACLGKDISFIMMKMVILSVICNYHVTLVDAHPVSPADLVMIHMKHGLKVKLSNKVPFN